MCACVCVREREREGERERKRELPGHRLIALRIERRHLHAPQPDWVRFAGCSGDRSNVSIAWVTGHSHVHQRFRSLYPRSSPPCTHAGPSPTSLSFANCFRVHLQASQTTSEVKVKRVCVRVYMCVCKREKEGEEVRERERAARTCPARRSPAPTSPCSSTCLCIQSFEGFG